MKIKTLGILLSLFVLLSSAFVPVIGVQAAGKLPDSNLNIQATDIGGDPGEPVIADWIRKGIITIGNDKKFKPSANITRLEFVSIVNKLFNFTDKANDVTLKDVYTANGSLQEVQKALAVGYIKPYSEEEFAPDIFISRQEFAEYIYKIGRINALKNDNLIKSISDIKTLSNEIKTFISAAVGNEYMPLYQGNSFRPTKKVTRSEAVVILSKVAGTLYNIPGTINNFTANAEIKGNVTISSPNVNLKNTTITGNLYLTEGIGKGSITLEKVTVMGTTIIRGGGISGVLLKDCTINSTVIGKNDGVLKIEATGRTSVGDTIINSGVTVIEREVTESGFNKLTVDLKALSNQSVKLTGVFTAINIDSTSTKLTLTEGNADTVTTAMKAGGSAIEILNKFTVKNLIVNSRETLIKGPGKINSSQINSMDTVIAQTPVNVKIKTGITATIAGKVVNNSNVNPPKIDRASLDINTGKLVLSGSYFTKTPGIGNDVTVSKINISDGEGGHSYTLTSFSSDVDITNPYTITIGITGEDLKALNWAVENGTKLVGNPYEIAAYSGWNGEYSNFDQTNIPLTVSGNPAPTITEALLDVNSGELVLTGNNLMSVDEGSDIIASNITLTDGTGGHSLKLSSATSNIEISGSTSAKITISGSDLSNVTVWTTQNGSNVNGNYYSLKTTAGWNGINSTDLNSIPFTVKGNGLPKITGATLNIATGSLVLTGNNFTSICYGHYYFGWCRGAYQNIDQCHIQCQCNRYVNCNNDNSFSRSCSNRIMGCTGWSQAGNE